VASGSTSTCSKIKYTDGAVSSDCKSYTVFIVSKKLVRFVFFDSKGKLTSCDVALGGKKSCVYYQYEYSMTLYMYNVLSGIHTRTADISVMQIT
jgi:hypothetical protein